jgi:hypothetical protein
MRAVLALGLLALLSGCGYAAMGCGMAAPAALQAALAASPSPEPR